MCCVGLKRPFRKGLDCACIRKLYKVNYLTKLSQGLRFQNSCFSFPAHRATFRPKQQRRAVFGNRLWRDSALFFRGLAILARAAPKKHDLIEMPMIALLATLTGRSSRNAFALFAKMQMPASERIHGAQMPPAP